MARNPRNAAAAAARMCAAVIAGWGVLFGSVAHAGLGEPVESVARDHAAVHGTALVVTPRQAYDVQETTTEAGLQLRQYVSHGGTVFAVAWSGRTLPDLKMVLGKHYDEYYAAASAHQGNHHVLSVATPNVVISITKVQRGFTGVAYVPALVPTGTSVKELR